MIRLLNTLHMVEGHANCMHIPNRIYNNMYYENKITK